ncbi:Uncharacterised protein [uncultured archaeon]|nr:Uncharacterised protein [uncultured archaeon]
MAKASVKIKSLGILSCAKIGAVIGAVVGLLVGIMIGIIGTATGIKMGSALLGSLGWIAVILLPIFYGAFGFVAVAIEAFLYNLIAEWIGGIEMELE